MGVSGADVGVAVKAGVGARERNGVGGGVGVTVGTDEIDCVGPNVGAVVAGDGNGVGASVPSGVGRGVGFCVGVGAGPGPTSSTRKTKQETKCSGDSPTHLGLPLPVTILHSSRLKVSVSMPMLSASLQVLLTFQTQRPTARPVGQEKVGGTTHRMDVQPDPISQAQMLGLPAMKLSTRSSSARSNRIQLVFSLSVSEQAISNQA